jgi:S-adenosylmethionine:tRNA ribosyltransferase-isomerase
MVDPDLLSSYEYDLPPELIAAHPAERRDAARMLVLERATGRISHRGVADLPELLRPGDLLVVNETRVVAARLKGSRTATGGRWEGLFVAATESGAWRIVGQTRGKLAPGESLTIDSPAAADGAGDRLQLTLIERGEEGEWIARPSLEGEPFTLLERFGRVPLPPYIERESPTAEDRERYQTVYARTPGAIAAPTAGLHFTESLLHSCRARGVETAAVTLHVGLGTFRPVTAKRLSEHVMHAEWCALPAETVAAIGRTRERGGRVVAVGTTTVRTLEAVAAMGELRAWSGETRLFIRPPYRFRVVDALLTNFHLPRSTLLVLLCAFAGRDSVLAAYAEAVRERYRFFSYGDAMFVQQADIRLQPP